MAVTSVYRCQPVIERCSTSLMLLGIGNVQHHPAVYLAVFQSGEDVIYRIKRQLFDSRFHLALSGKSQRLLQILPGPDNRASNGITTKHDIENRDRKLARW